MVAAAHPAVAVGGGKQCLGLGMTEERDRDPSEALGWYGEDARDEGGVFGMAQGREPEQRVDRGQAGVAALWAIAPDVFEMVEERADGGRVEVIELQPRGSLPLRAWAKASRRRKVSR